MARAFEQAMGLAGLLKRGGAVGERLNPTGIEQRPYLAPQRRRHRAFIGDAARAQTRAGERQALAHDRAEIDLGDHAALRRDTDMETLNREAAQIFLNVVAADHIEDDIDAAVPGR